MYVCARTHTGRRRQQQPLVHEQQDEWEGRNERWNHGKGLVVSIASKRVGFIRKNVGVRNCEFAWNWVKSSGVIEIFLDFKMSNAPFLDATIQLYTQVFCPCNAAVFKHRTKTQRASQDSPLKIAIVFLGIFLDLTNAYTNSFHHRRSARSVAPSDPGVSSGAGTKNNLSENNFP